MSCDTLLRAVSEVSTVESSQSDIATCPAVHICTSTSMYHNLSFGNSSDPLPLPTSEISLSSGTGSTDSSVCRICHEGESLESLISPCQCAGSMSSVHQTCVEKWLGSSSSNKCEICGYEYTTERRPKPFLDWVKNPSRLGDKRNLIGDCACFLVLTPLAIVSAWLCISGAMSYTHHKESEWEVIGLMSLAAFLVCIHLVWCSVAMRYHFKIYRDWQVKNQIVKVIDSSQGHAVGDFVSLNMSGTNVPQVNNNCAVVDTSNSSKQSWKDCDSVTNIKHMTMLPSVHRNTPHYHHTSHSRTVSEESQEKHIDINMEDSCNMLPRLMCDTHLVLPISSGTPNTSGLFPLRGLPVTRL